VRKGGVPQEGREEKREGKREKEREREREKNISRARVTFNSLPRISPGNSTPRPPSMRGGTCPLLPLKMQGESLRDPFILVTIIICRANLCGAPTRLINWSGNTMGHN